MLEVAENISSRMKIWLETLRDINAFVELASNQPSDMILNVVDDKGMCVNARSILGMMYATEFKHMWLVSNNDRIHSIFKDFAKE